MDGWSADGCLPAGVARGNAVIKGGPSPQARPQVVGGNALKEGNLTPGYSNRRELWTGDQPGTNERALNTQRLSARLRSHHLMGEIGNGSEAGHGSGRLLLAVGRGLAGGRHVNDGVMLGAVGLLAERRTADDRFSAKPRVRAGGVAENVAALAGAVHARVKELPVINVLVQSDDFFGPHVADDGRPALRQVQPVHAAEDRVFRDRAHFLGDEGCA